ncbi:MAG: polysaccharide deacetylase family protein [Armatimonadetes bacterium]|nr:polysaccharide deacetylase family protein [Armatimonadota bacterium]
MRIPIFYYHSVGGPPPQTLALESFRVHLDALRRAGCRTLTVAELLAAEVEKRSGDIVLSFDDGLLDNYTHVFPLLLEYGFRATFYVVPGHDGVTRWVHPRSGRWSDVPRPGYTIGFETMGALQRRELAAHGMEIGCHSFTHRKLTGLSPAELHREIVESRARLQEELGREVLTFCYPNGRFNLEILRRVEAAGYRGACSTLPGYHNPRGSRFVLHRFLIEDPGYFEAVAGGRAFSRGPLGRLAWRHVRTAVGLRYPCRRSGSSAVSAGEAPVRERLVQELDRFPGFPDDAQGRGVVVCAGGLHLLANAYVGLRRVRESCDLPVEIFYVGDQEIPPSVRRQMARDLGKVTFRDLAAVELPGKPSLAALRGFPAKPVALIASRFREVLLLDADNLPVRNPEPLFSCPAFLESGALCWPDLPQARYTEDSLYRAFGLPPALNREGPEFESGQMLLDRKRAWRGLAAVCLLHSEDLRPFVYARTHGDKDTFRLGFRLTATPYRLIQTPPLPLGSQFLYWRIPWLDREVTIPHQAGSFFGTGILQHGPDGEPLFAHRTVLAWSLYRRFRMMTHLASRGAAAQRSPWLEELEEGGFRYLDRFRDLYGSAFPPDRLELRTARLMKLGSAMVDALVLLRRCLRKERPERPR